MKNTGSEPLEVGDLAQPSPPGPKATVRIDLDTATNQAICVASGQ
ncbi:MAG: hypothetical protein ACYC3X_11495 [Pirellulaceae bacterium]